MFQVHYLTIALFVLFPFTFIGTYIAALLQGHVEANFPYISDAATYSPESCVFGQLINIGAVLLGVVIYARYCQIYQLNYIFEDRLVGIARLNKLSLYFGLISAFGLSIVANFQETNVKYVHFFGALLCFGCGSCYFWVQGVCSYVLDDNLRGRFSLVSHFRIGLAAVSVLFFFIASVTGVWSHFEYHGSDRTKWYPSDGGWVLHVVSTASEWVVAICFCAYVLTFYSELSQVSFSHPEIHVETAHVILSPEAETPSLIS